jgi:peptide/nickel transport system substrate-binding protein
MRHAVLLGVAVALVGCTKATPSALVQGRHPWTIPHVLRIAEMSDPDRLNPYLSTMGVTDDLSSLVYSYLVITDDRARLRGDLASSVPTAADGGISSDGRTYVYHLRRGISWQDGVPFTARDVVASWRAVMDPHNNTFEREGYDRVASIEAAGPTTVVVHLRRRYPPFVSHFFAQEDGKPVLPAHILAHGDFNAGDLSSHPVGTGKRRLRRWDAQRR